MCDGDGFGKDEQSSRMRMGMKSLIDQDNEVECEKPVRADVTTISVRSHILFECLDAANVFKRTKSIVLRRCP